MQQKQRTLNTYLTIHGWLNVGSSFRPVEPSKKISVIIFKYLHMFIIYLYDSCINFRSMYVVVYLGAEGSSLFSNKESSACDVSLPGPADPVAGFSASEPASVGL